MDDFKKQAELAKLSRMQGIKLSRPEAIAAPKRNRIEEALGGKVPMYEKEPDAYMPPIPARKVEEPVAAEKAKVVKKSYPEFLRKFFLGTAIVVLIAVVGLGGHAVFSNYGKQKSTTTAGTLEAVGKLVPLPQDEMPTIATVTDLTPLKDQAFFKEAEIGDKVVIYDKSKKAILYRPSTNKIIQIASLN